MSAVRVQREGPVTTVILERPEVRNAVDGPTAQTWRRRSGHAVAGRLERACWR